jgi:LEA14-like dessication related protein
MKYLTITIVLLSFILLAACSVEPPKARIEKVRLIDASIEKVRTEITVAVDNPNSFTIHIKEVRYALYVNGDKVVDDILHKEIDLPAKGSTTVKIPLGVSLSKVAGAGMEAMMKRRMNYKADAVVVVDSGVGGIEVPVTQTGTLNW